MPLRISATPGVIVSRIRFAGIRLPRVEITL